MSANFVLERKLSLMNWKRIFERFHLMDAIPFVFVICVWMFCTYVVAIGTVFLPAPDKALKSFLDLISRSFFLDHLVPSALRVGCGFLLSVGIAFPLGLMSSQVPTVARWVEPLCGFTRYLPVAAFVPLCIL